MLPNATTELGAGELAEEEVTGGLAGIWIVGEGSSAGAE